MHQTAGTGYPKTAKSLVFRRAAGVLLLALTGLLSNGCATLPPQTARATEAAFYQAEKTALGRLAHSATLRHPAESGFLILDTGRQAFLQRAALIEAAERSIDAQYYIWNSDRTGGYLARRLLLAADRGVRVRLLLDDINIGGRDAVIAALDRHPNIDIRIYNPMAARAGIGKWLGFIGDFQRLNRRMHNKTFVVDAAFGVVGGRNIGDEYFDLHPTMNHRDRDVLTAGPLVHDISANFDAYWNNAWSYPIELLASGAVDDETLGMQLEQARAAAADMTGIAHAPPVDSAGGYAAVEQSLDEAVWAKGELVFDPPAQDMQEATDTPKHTAEALSRQVLGAHSEILIESAYFILGDAQLARLGQVRQKGVRVAALTNSLASNDLTTNHAGYARRRPAMLAAGLDLHELRPDASACAAWIELPGYCSVGAVSLHAKSAVFDRETLYVGSFNINLRSIYLNGETILIIHSPLLAQRVAQDIEFAMAPANSWQVVRDADGRLRWSSEGGATWQHEPATGWWRRFKSGLFSLFPMEKYL